MYAPRPVRSVYSWVSIVPGGRSGGSIFNVFKNHFIIDIVRCAGM